MIRRAHARVGALVVLALAFGAAHTRAERLAISSYGVADGLPTAQVTAALEDANGFLWIGTTQGLSRFDGREFRHFGIAHGLAKPDVVSMAIAHDGAIWLGVWGGVFRFDPARGGSFAPVAITGVSRHIEGFLVTTDRRGRIWAAFDGLYVSDGAASASLRRFAFDDSVSLPFVSAVFADRDGVVWAGYKRLYRIVEGDRVVPVPFDQQLPADAEITSFAQDSDGRIWVGTSAGLWRIEGCDVDGRRPPCSVRFVAPIRTVRWNSLVPRDGGGVWIGTPGGLMEVDADGRLVRTITAANGLQVGLSLPLLVDKTGSLWIAAGASGLQRLSPHGFTSFGREDGLESAEVETIVTTRDGEVVVVGSPHVLQRFDGRRFAAVRPMLPATMRKPGWHWYQAHMVDREGDWWVPTEGGLLRYRRPRSLDALAREPPRAIYAHSGCFRGNLVFRVYEDTRGDIWVATIERDAETLFRWNRTTGAFECIPTAPLFGTPVAPTAFLDDGRGTIWIGFYLGQVARYRDGRLECVLGCDPADSLGLIHALFLDSRRRLWISTTRAGVIRVDDPTSDRPAARRLSTADGLASNLTGIVIEDRFGRICITTDRGMDVLDEHAGRILHYGVDEGMPAALVTSAARDANGEIWLGSSGAVTRFAPAAPERDGDPAAVLIDRLRIDGRTMPLSAAGQSHVDGVTLAANQSSLEVDFVGLPRQAAGRLRFQYRLSDRDEWSTATSGRSILLAAPAPGATRLEIRAIDPAGASSSRTATIALRVLTPFYRTTWFTALAVAAIGGLAFAGYRARTARSLALERQRTRIAMDLHDEMGSRLGSIGLLADLAAGETDDIPRRARLLNEIAETTAELGASLTDIVWSLRNTERTLEGLSRRLAAHGRRMFASGNPAFETRFPKEWPTVELSPAAGRHAFLIALEAMHNAARHAQARHVVLDIHPEGHRCRLSVQDDGIGFDRSGRSEGGFGLETMRRRAEEIGGTLSVRAVSDGGTRVSLLFDPGDGERIQSRTNIRRIWKRL